MVTAPTEAPASSLTSRATASSIDSPWHPARFTMSYRVGRVGFRRMPSYPDYPFLEDNQEEKGGGAQGRALAKGHLPDSELHSFPYQEQIVLKARAWQKSTCSMKPERHVIMPGRMRLLRPSSARLPSRDSTNMIACTRGHGTRLDRLFRLRNST